MKIDKKFGNYLKNYSPAGLLIILLSLMVFFILKNPSQFLGYKNVQEPILTKTAIEAPTPTPTSAPTASPIVEVPTNITIPEAELVDAINLYRQAHGLSRLNINQALCKETVKRVQDLISLNSGRQASDYILTHDGMAQDIANGILAKTVGMRSYGENLASAYCKRPSDNVSVDVKTGVQLVEWCLAGSPSHNDTLLKPEWTDVCSIGEFPFYVETFAK